MAKPQIGDERYLLEIISTEAVLALAKKQGWPGGEEGVREFCEPEDAAVYSVHKTLDEAVDAARKWLATGQSFYGCAMIDHQVYEQWHDDLGNRVKGADWERQKSFEVAMDDEVLEIAA